MIARRLLWSAVVWASLAPATLPAQARRTDPVSGVVTFAVLGHVRGDAYGLNPKLPELFAKVRALNPDFAVLTGDMIWGDVDVDPADSARVEREWESLDSALTTLGRPVFRVPGNHDINDLVTRDIYLRRYGPLPRAVQVGPVRLLLLSSAWLPADGDRRKHQYIRGHDLDPGQIAFLRGQLADTAGYRDAFVFLHHHDLWFLADTTAWWREVHPLLAAGKVRAVFSGDYGPMKFATMRRDGVAYYQSSIEDSVSIGIQRALESSWRLSSQFDNYLFVTAGPDSTAIDVHTVAEVSSGQFTPERYRAVAFNRPAESVRARLWQLVGSPKRLTAVALFLLGLVGLGYVWGRRGRRL